MIHAVLLIKHIVVRRKNVSGQHLVRHVERLAFDRVVRPDGVIDEVAALVEVIVLHKLFDEIDVARDLEVSVGAVVPRRPAHGEKIADVVGFITELEPRRHRPEGEAPERQLEEA